MRSGDALKPVLTPTTLVIPHWRSTIRHATPNVVEGKIIPVALFLSLLQWVGMTMALVGALLWSIGAVARRLWRKQAMSGLLVLTTVGLTARTIAALATGSLVIYFLQPTVATGLVGATLVGSVIMGRPLAERLIMDVCPVDDETRAHPTLRRFFTYVSLWWGFTSAINFAITLWVLISHSPATFVIVKSVLGPVTTAVTFIVAFFWFRALMARTGTAVVFADPA